MQTLQTSAILRMPQVIEKVGLSKVAIYALIKDGKFPKQIQLSARAIGFSEQEINQWISERMNEREVA